MILQYLGAKQQNNGNSNKHWVIGQVMCLRQLHCCHLFCHWKDCFVCSVDQRNEFDFCIAAVNYTIIVVFFLVCLIQQVGGLHCHYFYCWNGWLFVFFCLLGQSGKVVDCFLCQAKEQGEILYCHSQICCWHGWLLACYLYWSEAVQVVGRFFLLSNGTCWRATSPLSPLILLSMWPIVFLSSGAKKQQRGWLFLLSCKGARKSSTLPLLNLLSTQLLACFLFWSKASEVVGFFFLLSRGMHWRATLPSSPSILLSMWPVFLVFCSKVAKLSSE